MTVFFGKNIHINHYIDFAQQKVILVIENDYETLKLQPRLG